MSILQNKQVILELPQHKLIQDVKTRWNSTIDMVNRFVEQHPAIEATLQMKELKKNSKDVYTLSDEDIANAEMVPIILEPMKTATTLLCSEKSPTLYLIHPLKEMLLRQLQVQDSDNKFIKSLKTAITNDLEPRYKDENALQLLLESSCLDPRLKTMPYISDTQRRDVFSSLTMKAVTIYEPVKVKVEKGDDEEPLQPPLPILLSEEAVEPLAAAAGSTTNSTPGTSNQSSDVSVLEQPPVKKVQSASSELF